MSTETSLHSIATSNGFTSYQSFTSLQPILPQTASINDHTSLSLLSDQHKNIKIDEHFILKLPKDIKNVSREIKCACKVLHIASEWTLEEALTALDDLNPLEYPNLYIFVIDLNSAAEEVPARKQMTKKIKKIKKIVRKFGSNRPLIIQYQDEIRYRDEGSTDFIAYEQQPSSFWDAKNFPSFLGDFLNEKFENFVDFKDELCKLLPDIHKSLLLLRFLSTLNLSDPTFNSIIFEAAKSGTKSEFMASLDAPFDGNIRVLRNRVEQYLTVVDDDDEEQSILLTAVQHQNKDIIDYLITFWAHLIQHLPFDHQVRISTAAYDTNQLDVLCDLLDIADFPFPKDIKEQKHEQLNKIIQERSKLAVAIKAENYEELDRFLTSNQNLKIAYNPVNKSALQQAVDAKNYKIYYYLKTYSYTASEFDDIEDVLNDEEQKIAEQSMCMQRSENVTKALPEDQKSINLLCNRSFIHNRKVNKEQEIEYRMKIRKWYEDIHRIKFGHLFLDVAASCEDLKIIFGFDDCLVDNLSFGTYRSLGTMVQAYKWIFVGSKLTDETGEATKEREQQIKGTLVHELCHYVMKLVYENDEHPYYKIQVQIAEIFEEIVKKIDKWSGDDSEEPDDGCNGIISVVFTAYDRNDFHPELIVRWVQILVQFDDDVDMLKYLEDKYKILVNFWENQVIPDLRTFNRESRKAVRKMNRFFEVMDSLEDELYTFKEQKDIKKFLDHETAIVITNVPTLLFNNVYNYLYDEVDDIFDAENVFVDLDVLKNEEICRDFKKLLQKNRKLNIFVDCSSEVPDNVSHYKGLKTIYIVSSDDQYEELLKILNKSKVHPTKLQINYSWSDLTQESQELLLNHKVSFQNWNGLTFLELLMPVKLHNQPKSSESYKKAKNQVLKDFSSIVDDELLNLLVVGSDISIDVQHDDVQHDRNFDFLYIERDFIKKSKKDIKLQVNQGVKIGLLVNEQGHASLVPNISEDQLLFDVKDKTHVLISDIAGNGKSWTMKNFTNMLRDDEAVKWVTCVDLKQFIDKFKAQMDVPEFSAFMVDNILNLEQPFEGKVFKKLYKDGKVVILFDGFDEIAPDCAEFVSKLAQNFQSNDGNQLWIATRDYFEVDLQQKLNTDAVYGCVQLDLKDAIDLIAKSWILLDNDRQFASVDEFNDYLMNPDDERISYVYKAHQIVQKIFSNWLSPIGLPHLLTMIAECSKHDKDGIDLNLSIIFDKFMNKQYEKWTYDKGDIRKVANIQSQRYSMPFWRLHQYFAVAILFPEFLDVLFPECDLSEWLIEEIIACGLMSKFGDKILFVHSTYGEFFIADYLANELKKPKINDKILEIFIKILTDPKYVIVKVFLNHMLDNQILEKIRTKIGQICDIFDNNSNYKVEHFIIEMYLLNLDKFATFMLNGIKCEAYERKKDILKKASGSICANSTTNKTFNSFKNLLFDNLNLDDLKDVIINCGFLHGILRSQLDLKSIKNLIHEIELKVGKITIRNGLLATGTFGFGPGNIIYHLSQSPNFNPQKFKIFLEICQNYLNFNDICGLLMHSNHKNDNILNLCIMSESYPALKDFWREIQIMYSTYCSSHQLKLFFKLENSKGFISLDFLVAHPDVNLHRDFWDILLDTIVNRDELMDLILKNDKLNNSNYFHKLMLNMNSAVIELVVDILQHNLTKSQFTEIIKSHGIKDLTLLQIAAVASKVIDVHRLIWKLVRQTCSSDDEFLTKILKISSDGSNILQYSAQGSTKDVFEFIIMELEKRITADDIYKMLIHRNIYGYSMIHYCVMQNLLPDLHTSVWNVMRRYLSKSDIVHLIQHVNDESGENILHSVVIKNSLQIVQITWNEIRQYLTYDEQIQYLKSVNKAGKNLLERVSELKTIGKDKIGWILSMFQGFNIFTDYINVDNKL
ncbi:uncharacterized protein [Chironomus tepperi]|uniref:uncharacterized protein n=1 Tax=Chironomus tepperi TaxID=113505 RepID=UPI00391F68B6